jgi:hypothetical protein
MFRYAQNALALVSVVSFVWMVCEFSRLAA